MPGLLDTPAANYVCIGDTATDRQAGSWAAMRTAGELTGFDDYDSLQKDKPEAIIDSIRYLAEAVAV